MDHALDQAQATAIGGILHRPTEAATVFTRVRVEDFDPPYRQIAEAIHGLRLEQKQVGPLPVIDEMTRRGTIGRVGGPAEVMRVSQLGFGSIDYACEVIARYARLRRLNALAGAAAAEATHPDADPHRLARIIMDGAQAVLDGIESEGDVIVPTLAEFLAGDDPEHDWVIPGLLERGDRFVLTGVEGGGKSTAQKAIAVAAASGVHPFKHHRIKPCRVLYIDCENGSVKMRRSLRPLVELGKRQGVDPGANMWVECIPQGLDLTKPEDEMWLVKLVTSIQPDLLITGPLYRLHAANPNDEQPAREVARVLDRCRSASNCALITEAHSGHGFGGDKRPVRPTGTSLWLRWPEFGYGLRPTDESTPQNRIVDFVPWRGDREARDWPRQLRQGTTAGWPWEAVPDRFNPTAGLA